MAEKYVKVSRLGSRVQEFSIENGTTIEEAISKADMTVGSNSVRLNGKTVTDLSRVVKDGDKIILAPPMKGAH